jgi:hypothetical protein
MTWYQAGAFICLVDGLEALALAGTAQAAGGGEEVDLVDKLAGVLAQDDDGVVRESPTEMGSTGRRGPPRRSRRRSAGPGRGCAEPGRLRDRLAGADEDRALTGQQAGGDASHQLSGGLALKLRSLHPDIRSPEFSTYWIVIS